MLLAWSMCMISDSAIRKCQLGSYCFDPIIQAFSVLVQLPKDQKYISLNPHRCTGALAKHVLIKTLAISKFKRSAIRKHKYEIDGSKDPRKLLDMMLICTLMHKAIGTNGGANVSLSFLHININDVKGLANKWLWCATARDCRRTTHWSSNNRFTRDLPHTIIECTLL